MLQIKDIRKEYKTGGLVQKALDGVSLNLRENEFVAILGPSGSGKTTLLNMIGGLDRYDSGDLIINGISTKKYKDRDWDSYRNHTIGFVFQSYNLIPHQSILSNVELALTISGVSKGERRKRAQNALAQVGLGDQLHKKPSQMSGGQMQRVAIARALVNDPDILLADEPTGALDSDTSVQVMELLREVAKNRLVVMVTHNPELAEKYATRIVQLRDGRICSDTAPFEMGESGQVEPIHKNMGKASMSFLTALSLSFHNLRTKKARTLLTSFAGSIGIIGIALILALSNGVNAYIQSIEEDTLSEYPLQIQSSGMDFTAMMEEGSGSIQGGPGQASVSQRITSMLAQVEANDLASLKEYFDSGESGIEQYAKAIEYTYHAAPQIFRLEDSGVRQVNPDQSFSALGVGSASGSNNFVSMMMNTDVFHPMPEDTSLFQKQYEVKAGRWPERYNECVVVLTSGGSISDLALYAMGLRDSLELDEMIRQFIAEEDVKAPTDLRPYDYEELLDVTFKLVNAADYFEYDDTYNVWKDKSGDEEYMRELVSQGEDITIVGVVQPREDAIATILDAGIGYPAALTQHVIEEAAASSIVQEQLAGPNINVLTGDAFGADDGQGGFNLESLFTINEDALQNAFSIDQRALNVDMSRYFNANSLDLSSMLDLNQFTFDLPELDGAVMGDVLGRLDLSASTEKLHQLACALADGYGAYALTHPEADYSGLSTYFMEYLQTPEAKQRLHAGICKIVQSNVEADVSLEEMKLLIQDILSGYQSYVTETQLTDPDKFGESLHAYLQTPEVEAMMAERAPDILKISEEVTISQEELDALAADMVKGYQEYAAAKALPDPSKMSEHFHDYLQTSEAQMLLTAEIAEIIDAKSLEAQISDAIGDYMQTVTDSYTEAVAQAMQLQMAAATQQIVSQQAMEQIGANMEDAFTIDADAFANAIEMNMDENELTELLRSMMTAEDASFDGNLNSFGYADLSKPAQIDIYPLDFESKESIAEILGAYNSRMTGSGQEEKVISYTDLVGTMMSSMTEIVNTISYVLVAFVAISLVVSSIMIGVITYISVLERKKEIGILRAIGASKGNISQVFNAEAFIIGLCAGLIGIGMTLLLLIPCNALIHSMAGSTDIHAVLPPANAVVLILLSVVLTLIGGLIPSRKAAKSDPVAALRAD